MIGIRVNNFISCRFITYIKFTRGIIGIENAEIINNLGVNIVENSYGKDCIILDDDIFDELKTAKLENNNIIYKNERIDKLYNENLRPMFQDIYYKLLEFAKNKSQDSVLYKHHIDYINKKYYPSSENYFEQEPNQIVVDYIASMTDDYFIDLYNFLFPHSKHKIKYVSYFDS